MLRPGWPQAWPHELGLLPFVLSSGLGARPLGCSFVERPGFGARLGPHSLGYLTSWSLSFPICDMGTAILPTGLS